MSTISMSSKKRHPPSKEKKMTASNTVPDPAGLTNASLEGLQNVEQADLMDLVDKLRRNGASAHLQLPQIVVCGDQSSGKSSTLEALTGIPFPRKENLCTRFATEISMRRDPTESISCKITPDDARPDAEQQRLLAFSRTINNFSQLPDIIEEATKTMGLDATKAFSRDVLSIVICGPDRPQLTVVDLPGLIHSSNKSQTEADVGLIKSLVTDYISSKRTIILAVVSAKNDYANQIILKMCREIDPNGARTLGVITKPDFLRPDSENESTWLDLVQNKDIYFELGWHMLINCGDGEHQLSFLERNASEQAFFACGNYKSLPSKLKGIDSLRARLSQLLFSHLKQELPALKDELEKLLRSTTASLNTLGKSRASTVEQKVYLTELFTGNRELIISAMRGNYEGDFFGTIDLTSAVDDESNSSRLRAVVQFLNLQFADRMRQFGHKYEIQEAVAEQMQVPASTLVPLVKQESDRNDTKLTRGPMKITHENATKWVINVLQRSRGTELPGIFNPTIISHLFWDQSEGWERIADVHIAIVAELCRRFAVQLLVFTSAPDVKPRLLSGVIEPALKKARCNAKTELSQIVADLKQHPITYNHYFIDVMQKIKNERQAEQIRLSTETAEHADHKDSAQEVQTVPTSRSMQTDKIKRPQEDMDKHSAVEALDAMAAYYKDKLKFFVDAIAIQVIERHLISALPDMLAPSIIAKLTDKEIGRLAGEPAQTVQLREHLQSKKNMLEEGQAFFRQALGDVLG